MNPIVGAEGRILAGGCLFEDRTNYLIDLIWIKLPSAKFLPRI